MKRKEQLAESCGIISDKFATKASWPYQLLTCSDTGRESVGWAAMWIIAL
jgi:hypothetical protein